MVVASMSRFRDLIERKNRANADAARRNAAHR